MSINDPLSLNQYASGSGGRSSTPAQNLNYQQDLLSYLMSANTGIGTGTFDPMLAVPPTYTPPATTYLDSFERSPTPVLSAVAKKIRAGIIDPASAVAEIATTLGITENISQNGFDMKGIRDNVSAMFAEVTASVDAENKHALVVKDWETTNQYGKGGFSQPYEQYTMDTLPFSSDVRDKQSQLDWLAREAKMNREMVQPKYNEDLQAIYEKMLADYPAPKPVVEDVEVNKDERSATKGSYGAGSATKGSYGKGSATKGSYGAGSASRGSYGVAGKTINDKKSKSDNQDQAGRMGIALSMKAAELARAKNPLNQKTSERDKLTRELMITKMAELAAAQYMGRTPFGDQMSQRASSI